MKQPTPADILKGANHWAEVERRARRLLATAKGDQSRRLQEERIAFCKAAGAAARQVEKRDEVHAP